MQIRIQIITVNVFESTPKTWTEIYIVIDTKWARKIEYNDA